MAGDEVWRRVRQPDRETERVAAELIEALFAVASAQGTLTVPPDDPKTRAARLVAYGWSVRAVRTAEAVRLLHSAGLVEPPGCQERAFDGQK
jgi:hypothetical protein